MGLLEPDYCLSSVLLHTTVTLLVYSHPCFPLLSALLSSTPSLSVCPWHVGMPLTVCLTVACLTSSHEQNDISDVLDLTFSMDADEEKHILYEKAQVRGYDCKLL